jgi:lysine-N-methylase
MWRTDGLCRIQAELGEAALCKTCREFPRLTHDYGDFVEMGLELSCPEAARLILTSPPAPFVITEVPGGDEPEYDREAMEILLQTREEALALLLDSRYTVSEALALLLIYGYHAQALVDGMEVPPFDHSLSLSQARDMAKASDMAQFITFFENLEILTETWPRRLAAPCPDSWSEGYRNLARYGIQRYWLQAVSDYDLVGRVKFILISCLLIRHLGGDLLTTAQCYSKEIENSAENMDALLDGAYTHPAFTDDKLLWQLLNET